MRRYYNRLAKTGRAGIAAAAMLLPGMEAQALLPGTGMGTGTAGGGMVMRMAVMSALLEDESAAARELREAITDPAQKPAHLQKLGMEPWQAKHISFCRDQSGLEASQDPSLRLSKIDEIVGCLDETAKEHQLAAGSPEEAIAEGMDKPTANRHFECRQEMGIENGQPLKSAFKAKVQDCVTEKENQGQGNGLFLLLGTVLLAGGGFWLFTGRPSEETPEETKQKRKMAEKIIAGREKRLSEFREHRNIKDKISDDREKRLQALRKHRKP